MNHQEKVQRIAEKLKNKTSKDSVVLLKKSVSHQVPKKYSNDKKHIIDVSDLNEIITINQEDKTCTAEPGVTFSDLVKETLKHNLVPIVVPELKTITIGGAVAGCSVESMSYKYGGFHDTCKEYEVITAKGDILQCSKKKNKEIFEMMHGTFGTIGIITQLKFNLLPAKQFVHLTYEKYQTLKQYKKAIESHYQTKDCDFMDGIIHSPELYVLCIGNFVDSAPYSHNYNWMRIFYKSTKEQEEDYLATYDYFYRYDAGCHWIARNYGLENPILRFLFGRFFLPSTNMLKLAKKLAFVFKKIKPDVVVDVFIPFSKLMHFFDFYNKEFQYYPLWVVPYKIKLYPWINPKHITAKDGLYIDIAIYGMKQKDKNYYRIMEEYLLKNSSMKTLISHNFLLESEFWQMWSKENYYKVKAMTDPGNIFNDLFHKMVR